MSIEAYEYFSQIQDVSTQEGVLYAQQPYQIKGNVRNVQNSDEALLGYFLVSGVTQKRIFVNRPPSDQVKFYYGICELNEADFEAYTYIRWTPSHTWPLYVTTDVNGRRALPDQDCIDCRKRGGTIVKPEFWED